MWQRIKTALVLVTLVLVCLFATKNPTPMIILMTVGGVLTAHEWSNLIPKLKNAYFFIATVVVIHLTSFFWQEVIPVLWLFSLAIWIFAAYWVKAYPKNTAVWFNKYLLSYVGIIIITATMSSMFYLWQQSPWWLLYAMMLGWAADTGAYFAGKNFGRYKLAPNVSPKKTYEGLLGGMVLCLIVSIVIAKYILNYNGNTLFIFVMLSMVASGLSVLGDLFESMVKRMMNVKDSGNLLPGHGGLLDRIDSMLASLPIFALGFMTYGLAS